MNFTQPESKRHTSQGGTKNKVDLHTKLKPLERAAFQKFFREHGLREEVIFGDGNCFFSTCAQQEIWLEKIATKQYTFIDQDCRDKASQQIRQDVCDFMKQAGDYSTLFAANSHTDDLFASSAKSLDEFICRMREPREHADELVVAAVARQRERDIQVYKYDKNTGIRMVLYRKDPKAQDGQNTEMNQIPNCDMLARPDTVRCVFYAHQHDGVGHYNSIIANKVCERSLDPSPLD